VFKTWWDGTHHILITSLHYFVIYLFLKIAQLEPGEANQIARQGRPVKWLLIKILPVMSALFFLMAKAFTSATPKWQSSCYVAFSQSERHFKVAARRNDKGVGVSTRLLYVDPGYYLDRWPFRFADIPSRYVIRHQANSAFYSQWVGKWVQPKDYKALWLRSRDRYSLCCVVAQR